MEKWLNLGTFFFFFFFLIHYSRAGLTYGEANLGTESTSTGSWKKKRNGQEHLVGWVDRAKHVFGIARPEICM